MEIKLAEADHELEQILQLQKENHYAHISEQQKNQQGFVTVRHDIELLRRMNNRAQHVIAVNEEKVIGYALVMVPEMQEYIPVLQPMFQLLEQLEYRNYRLREIDYYIMGQICIAENYRGQNIVGLLYNKHKETYASKYALCLTEVSTSNPRSMRAHQKVGFNTIHTYRDKTDEWNILCWDWAEKE